MRRAAFVLPVPSGSARRTSDRVAKRCFPGAGRCRGGDRGRRRPGGAGHRFTECLPSDGRPLIRARDTWLADGERDDPDARPPDRPHPDARTGGRLRCASRSRGTAGPGAAPDHTEQGPGALGPDGPDRARLRRVLGGGLARPDGRHRGCPGRCRPVGRGDRYHDRRRRCGDGRRRGCGAPNCAGGQCFQGDLPSERECRRWHDHVRQHRAPADPRIVTPGSTARREAARLRLDAPAPLVPDSGAVLRPGPAVFRAPGHI
jgi:hypothetical protein